MGAVSAGRMMRHAMRVEVSVDPIFEGLQLFSFDGESHNLNPLSGGNVAP